MSRARDDRPISVITIAGRRAVVRVVRSALRQRPDREDAVAGAMNRPSKICSGSRSVTLSPAPGALIEYARVSALRVVLPASPPILMQMLAAERVEGELVVALAFVAVLVERGERAHRAAVAGAQPAQCLAAVGAGVIDLHELRAIRLVATHAARR